MNWFLHDRDLRHERVNFEQISIFSPNTGKYSPEKTRTLRTLSRSEKLSVLVCGRGVCDLSLMCVNQNHAEK